MAFFHPSIYAAALMRIAEAKTLFITKKEVSSTEELSVFALGQAPVRFMRTELTLTVLPIRGGEVTAPGEGTHFALSVDGLVLLSAPLERPKILSLGNAFEVDRFDIDFL
jgi:hypothetical protein